MHPACPFSDAMKDAILLLARQQRRRRPARAPRPAVALDRWPTDDEVIDAIRSVPGHFATTYTYSGQLTLTASLQVLFGGDTSGTYTGAIAQEVIAFDVDGGTVPTLSGFVHGATVTAAAGNWLIADPDPFQGQGDATFSPGFTMGTTHKVKLFIIVNNDATNAITIINGGSAGTTLFDGTASHGTTVEPGGIHLTYDPTGARSGALTTTTNDKLTVSVGGGTPSLEVLIGYGL